MEANEDFVVRGRIVQKKSQQGIYGLQVVAYDRDHLFDDRLGSTYTDEGGRFELRYQKHDFQELFESRPDLYIVVLDWKGTTLYSSVDAVLWNAGRVAEIDAAISEDRLTSHLENFRPLKRLKGGLVAAEKLAVIERAVGLLEVRIGSGEIPPMTAGRSPMPGLGEQVPISAHYCPAPDILLFEDLIDVSWAVVINEPLAVRRYQDIIGTVIYRQNVRKAEQVAAVSKRWSQPPHEDTQAFRSVLQAKRAHLPPAQTDTLIETERLLPVFAAAVIVANGDTTVENRYLSFLLGQVMALGQLDVVYRAARDALTRNPDGIHGFGNMLRHVGGTCGPDDGPLFSPPRLEDWHEIDEMWRLEKWHCTMEASNAVRRGLLRGGSYFIRSIDWGDGCPGSPVVITGAGFSGFFPERNRVCFTHRSGEGSADAAPAAPEDWTDSRIVVTIPEEAGPGPVTLSIVGSLPSVCGHGIGPARRGNSMNFHGGAAYIRVFNADGQRGPEVRTLPGEAVELDWYAVPSGAALHLRVVQDGSVLADGSPANGSYSFSTPAGTASETHCTLTARSGCPGEHTREITVRSGIEAELSIVGVEVTQAVQYYHSSEHLTDVNDRGDDNSVRLVAHKPAWVRVYLRSGLPLDFNRGELGNASGSLTVERFESRTWSTVATLGAINSPYTARASYPSHHAERNDIDATLNFTIPANEMHGLLWLTVSALSPDRFAGAGASDFVSVLVDLEQRLQVAALRIGYNGPNLAGTANVVHGAPALNGPGGLPVPGTCAAECEFALTIFPVSSALTLRSIGLDNATAPLDTLPSAGGCDPSWLPIIDMVEDARDNDGNQAGWLYFGFVTPNIPTSHSNSGCAQDSNAAGIVGGGATFAHEAGHQVGMPHAPCGAVGSVNSRYPLYEPYDTGATHLDANRNTVWNDASTGEYGLDVNTGIIADPNICKDFMSYCGPRWVSLHSHDHMIENGTLSPTALPAGFAPGRVDGGSGTGVGSQETPRSDGPRPLITIRGQVDEAGRVTVRRVVRMEVRHPGIEGTKTEYVAELLDVDDRVASSASVYASVQHWHAGGGGGCCGGDMVGQGDRVAPPFRFMAVLEDVVEGQALRMRRGDETVWRKDRPAQKPVLGRVDAAMGEDLRLELSWSYEVPAEGRPTVWLRWSGNQGESWNGLAVGISEDSAGVDTGDLPAGNIRFQVLSHDGFYSISKESPAVSVPERPPLASIIHPREDRPLSSTVPLRLLGSVSVRSHSRLGEEDYIWYIDDQEVGRGIDLFAQNPGRGEHQIRLVVDDPAGQAEVSASVRIL